MTATTQWIIDTMEEWAPQKWAMDTDNVGLMIGDRARPVRRILTALDVTEGVLREAVQGRFDFIVTHHPIFSRHIPPINSITTDNALGKKIMTLIGNGIGLFSAHTNLDVAPGGVGDLLFDLVGLQNKEDLIDDPENRSLGLVGYLPSAMPLSVFARHVQEALAFDGLRYSGSPDKQISKVACCGGNGTSLVNAVKSKKCDAYITGDIGYHLAIDCVESGLALIDGSHFSTEIPIAKVIAEYLKNAAGKQGIELFVEETSVDGQVFKTIDD